MNQWLRVALLVLLILVLYAGGMPPTVLLLFALVFGALLLFRDRIWNALHNAVGGMSFMDGRPEWMRYAAVLLLFMVTYYVLKFMLFSLLQLAGFDLQQELLNAMNAKQ